MNWIPTTERLPEPCVPVIGHSSKWIHEDYNPSGIRECFRMDEGYWNSAMWDNEADCYDTAQSGPPEFWQHYPPAP